MEGVFLIHTHSIRKSRMRLPSSWSKWKHAFACNNPSMKDLSLNFSTHVPPNFDSYRNFCNVWLRNPGGGQNWPNVRQSSRSVVDWSRVCYTFKKFKNRNTRTYYARSYLHNNNPKPMAIK